MRNAANNRLILSGVVLAALPFAICSVPWAHTTIEGLLHLRPWAHVTLEAFLNLLWVLLAMGAIVHWTAPDCGGRRSRLSGLVSLVFVLALLFPVISADDDFVQLDLINDVATSQSVTLDLKSHNQVSNSTAVLSTPVVLAAESSSSLPFHSELMSESARLASVATPGDTTGNHSPPLC